MAERGRPKGSHASVARVLGAALLEMAAEEAPLDDGTSWPSVKYQKDPVAYVREVLGAEPTEKQRSILMMATRPGRKAIKSGRKTGKSTVAAWLALWFYCSFPGAQVYITAPHHKQINDIVWREIRRWHRVAKIKIDGDPSLQPSTGLRSPDDRTIKGFVASTKEGAQGYSGAQLYIVDEASAKELDAMYEALEGNRAGGDVPVFLFGNPTRNEGELYDAFHSKSKFYETATLSSLDSPNVIAGKTVIPYMADPKWVDEMRVMHGEDSPFWKIHVLGEFAEDEEGKIISVQRIVAAQQGYEEADDAGPLVIGLDPSGAGPAGDEGVFQPRRAWRLYEPIAYRSLDADGYVVNLRAILKQYLLSNDEKATVVIDREGSVGAELYGRLLAEAAKPNSKFRVVGVRAGQKAERAPLVYLLTRDELWASMADWLRDGGKIPEHTKLEKDLHAPSWSFDARRRMIATDKKELKKLLGRSPDYGDAACLAVWVDGDEKELDQKPRTGADFGGPDDKNPQIYEVDRTFGPYGRR